MMSDPTRGMPKQHAHPFAREAGAELVSFTQVRERSRRVKLARELREGRYEPNLEALATMLLNHPDFQR